MNDKEILVNLGLKPQMIPFEIRAQSQDEFRKGFRDLFTTPEARSAIHVVYVWATGRPFPRLKGSSNIIYIGQTIQSLSARHARWAATEANDGNWPRYQYILKEFGPIRVLFSKCSNPRAME